MNENCFAYGIEISDSDWDKTPARVKQLVEKMGQHIKKSEEKLAELEAKQQELLEKINCTSKNSSSPPSSDPLHAEKHQEKKKSRHLRKLSKPLCDWFLSGKYKFRRLASLDDKIRLGDICCC